MKWVIAILIALSAQAVFAENENTIYDSDSNHLWNRLNKTLFERTAPDGKHYGLDQMDILYWNTTTNLLVGDSHQKAINVLDEFINSHREKLVQDLLKKALLQRDLWALFDWTADGRNWNYKPERKELLKRLAIAIQRLELTTNEIASLPDNYALSVSHHLTDLPAGLLQTNSDWVNISVLTADRLVPSHDAGFGGRSIFMVWFHDAEGRNAGTNYLNQLNAVQPMWVPFHRDFPPSEMDLNPHFPQFPTNSQWALVRRMCVIDTDGQIQPTRVVESIQLRTYRQFKNYFQVNDGDRTNAPQHFNEFQMTRPNTELISIGQDEGGFTSNNHFFSFGIDPFEGGRVKEPRAIVLDRCMQCHVGTGIYSVNSFTRALSNERNTEKTKMVESNGKREEMTTVSWKENHSEFGLLQGLWMQNN